MATRELTATQKEILKTLIKLYEEKKRMVKSREVAEYLGKDEGTVRNIIMWLRGMGLVDSRTGPAGGYVPTLKAYQYLSEELGSVSVGYGELYVYKEDGRKLRLMVQRVEIINLLSTSNIRALVHIAGPTTRIRPGDSVRLVSFPRGKIIIEGRVVQVNPVANEVLINVSKLIVIPDVMVGKIMTRRLITIQETVPVRQAAKILHLHGIRGAPVVDDKGKVVGFITTTDISKLVAMGEDLSAPVSKYMKRHVFTISESESLIDAIKLMDYHSVGRLLVLNSRGDPVGIVTRTDILRYIVGLGREGSGE